ncbi:hypothetical protein [Streptomyces sp. NBC_00645]|uniref:hypothetical protein n=1 Tax=Streptomyces sp. NBC_00645 TaxID=2975795 RepID=UPI00324D739F
MARIRVLEAIAGADFSWAPGDLVDLPDEQAALWADGHRAELADLEELVDPGLQVEEMTTPRVVTADGVELEVLQAVVEEIDPPEGVEGDETWGQWVVTVALPQPTPVKPGSDPAVPPVVEESPAPAGGDGAPDGDTPAPAAPPFDPSEHSNREVLAYLDTVGEEEALRVLDEEAAGEDRAGIRKHRAAVLEAARLRQPAREVAADDSRGGGRGEQPETRDW